MYDFNYFRLVEFCYVTQDMVYADESPCALEKEPYSVGGRRALEMLIGSSWLHIGDSGLLYSWRFSVSFIYPLWRVECGHLPV